MRVVGNKVKNYILNENSKKVDYDGTVYEVSNLKRPGSKTFVKLYSMENRTEAQQNKVINAANGNGGILGPCPIEPVYQRGRFVGYSYEVEVIDGVPEPPKKDYTQQIIVCGAVMLLLTLVVRFGLVGILVRSSSDLAGRMLGKGWVMLIAAWIAGILAFQMTKDSGTGRNILLTVAAFAAGCVVVYVLTTVLAAIILAIEVGVSIFVQILPSLITTVIMGALLVYVVKMILK